MKKDEIKCLSCNFIIKVQNLKRHFRKKTHLKNVENKVNYMKRNIVK
jgi:hypothetical protein